MYITIIYITIITKYEKLRKSRNFNFNKIDKYKILHKSKKLIYIYKRILYY